MMSRKLLIAIAAVACIAHAAYAEEQKPPPMESDQQISDFSLAGYGDKGKKTWDIAGKSADIFTDVVKLHDVEGNLYGTEENIKLTADKGDFNKTDGKVHLEKNVVVTTSSGTKLNTDTLNWDRKGQVVSTEDQVNIQRENMTLIGRGAKGETNLKKVALEKDITLNINPSQDTAKSAAVKEKITIVCDGPLDIDYDKNVATFYNNVKIEREDSTIYSDRMDIYFLTSDKKVKPEPASSGTGKSQAFMGSKIDKIIARGNVKVVRGENVSYSQEAIYSGTDKKLTLSGRPKLVIYSSEGFSNASPGN